MKERKEYNAPSIKTEKIEIGVFGQYHGQNPKLPYKPVPWFKPHRRRR